jgi:2-oxoglutarate dehydrogenase complex dehydrogenase (E1) component-like enzyme
VFLPPTAETALDPVLPDHPAISSRTSFPPSSEMLAATELQARLSALINAHRVRGHLFADLDPLRLEAVRLGTCRPRHNLLDR